MSSELPVEGEATATHTPNEGIFRKVRQSLAANRQAAMEGDAIHGQFIFTGVTREETEAASMLLIAANMIARGGSALEAQRTLHNMRENLDGSYLLAHDAATQTGSIRMGEHPPVAVIQKALNYIESSLSRAQRVDGVSDRQPYAACAFSNDDPALRVVLTDAVATAINRICELEGFHREASKVVPEYTIGEKEVSLLLIEQQAHMALKQREGWRGLNAG